MVYKFILQHSIGIYNLHFHQQSTRVSFSPHPCQYFALVFLIRHPNGCEVVLAFISLIISDADHLFMYLFTFVCLWKNVYSGPLPIFKLELFGDFFFLLLSCMSYVHILDINPYQICGLQIFSSIL